jgi:hypothetical protein
MAGRHAKTQPRHDSYEAPHIRESRVGSFTAAARSHHEGTQEFASTVLANKSDYSTAMVKKAQFAHNASEFNNGHPG